MPLGQEVNKLGSNVVGAV